MRHIYHHHLINQLQYLLTLQLHQLPSLLCTHLHHQPAAPHLVLATHLLHYQPALVNAVQQWILIQ